MNSGTRCFPRRLLKSSWQFHQSPPSRVMLGPRVTEPSSREGGVQTPLAAESELVSPRHQASSGPCHRGQMQGTKKPHRP